MDQGHLQLRAVASSYVVLCGLWFLLAFGYIALELTLPGRQLWMVAALLAGIGLAWAVWLGGFRIELVDGVLRYRDGFYRAHSISAEKIARLEYKWLEWRLLTRVLRVPRYVFIDGQGKTMLTVNPKPFARSALTELRAALAQGTTDGLNPPPT